MVCEVEYQKFRVSTAVTDQPAFRSPESVTSTLNYPVGAVCQSVSIILTSFVISDTFFAKQRPWDCSFQRR